MRVIDSKGRLFGKINIVDLAVVIVIIFISITAVRFIYKTASAELNWTNVYMRIYSLDPWTAYSIKVGDTQRDVQNRVLAEIVDVYVTDSRTPSKKDMILKAKIITELNPEGKLLFQRYYEVAVGIKLALKINGIVLYGPVICLGEKPDLIKEKIAYINLRVYDKPYELINLIKIGDSEIDSNRTIAKIIDKQIIPRENSFSSHLNKDILLKAKIIVQVIDNQLFFKNQNIKIGKSIDFETDNYYIKGTIESISDKPLEKSKIQKIITLLLYDKPEITDKIQVGLKESTPDGSVTAEILDKKTELAEYVGMLPDGTVKVAENPLINKVILQVKIYTTLEDGSYIFHGERIKMGEQLEIRTKDINIKGKIIDIQ